MFPVRCNLPFNLGRVLDTILVLSFQPTILQVILNLRSLNLCLAFSVSWAVSALASVIFSTDFVQTAHLCSKPRMFDYIQGAKSHFDSESAVFMGYIHGISVYTFYRTVVI